MPFKQLISTIFSSRVSLFQSIKTTSPRFFSLVSLITLVSWMKLLSWLISPHSVYRFAIFLIPNVNPLLMHSRWRNDFIYFRFASVSAVRRRHWPLLCGKRTREQVVIFNRITIQFDPIPRFSLDLLVVLFVLAVNDIVTDVQVIATIHEQSLQFWPVPFLIRSTNHW